MRLAPLVLALMAVSPTVAGAQTELTAFLGYRGGDVSFAVEAEAPFIACLVPPCVVADAHTPEGETRGLVLDVPVGPGWAVEVMLDRQQGSLELATSLPPEAGPLAEEAFELTTFQMGLMRRWEEGPGGLAPFVVAGLGVARAETSARVLMPGLPVGVAGQRVEPEEALSVSLGGGARLTLDPRWGVRFEARGSWTDLPREIGGELVQAEIRIGLSARL